ncbi:MAG: histidine triad nucleotide-binding protein [Rhodospirillales bacterium]
MAYDNDNIFAKILRGEIPNNTVYENDHALAFHDIAPQRPVHVMVIPKGPYEDFSDFAAKATAAEQVALNEAILESVKQLGLEEGGYRLLVNTGPDSGQEVPHLHYHICGGGPLGPLLSRP